MTEWSIQFMRINKTRSTTVISDVEPCLCSRQFNSKKYWVSCSNSNPNFFQSKQEFYFSYFKVKTHFHTRKHLYNGCNLSLVTSRSQQSSTSIDRGPNDCQPKAVPTLCFQVHKHQSIIILPTPKRSCSAAWWRPFIAHSFPHNRVLPLHLHFAAFYRLVLILRRHVYWISAIYSFNK